jgi:sodium/proline symporter
MGYPGSRAFCLAPGDKRSERDMSATAQIWLVFGAVIAVFLAVGKFAASRGSRTTEDFLTGGRSFGQLLVGLSLFASAGSGFMVVGAVGSGYVMGLSALWLPLAFGIGDYIFWRLFPERINEVSHKRSAMTVPHYIALAVEPERRVAIRRLVGLMVFALMSVYLAAQLFAIGKVLNAMMGVELNAAIIAGGLVILCYCALGGLRASIWNESIQGLLELCLCLGLLGYALYMLGGPFAGFDRLSAEQPKLANPLSGIAPFTFVFYLIGFAMTGFGFGLGTPSALTRIVAGKDSETVRRARKIYMTCAYTQWFGMTIFGITAAMLLPGIADPEQSVTLFALREFPPLVVGLVLAAIFAAIASAAGAQTLVCSSALTEDIAGPGINTRGMTGIRIATAVVMVAAILLALISQRFNVFTIVIFVNAVIASAIAPAVMIVTLGWRLNAASIASAILFGSSVSVIWKVSGLGETVNEALPGFIASLLAFWLVRRASKA